jgi:catechol 2,3-dioxygenase-like lactoylglutathione lyase family enzyme
MMREPEQQTLHLKRPCLAIADLARSLSLYRDILGFRLDYDSPADANSYLYKVFGFSSAAKLHFAALSSDCESRALALTEVKGIELPEPSQPQRLGLVVRVRSLDDVIAKVQQLGLTVIDAHSFDAPPNLRFTEQAICDFDGHLIILYQVQEI